MSLFERIKNRRYNLTEQPTDKPFTAQNRKDVKKILSKITNDPKGTADEVLQSSSKSVTSPKPGDVATEKSIVRNFNKKEKKFSKTNVTSSGRVKATSDILKSSGGATSKQKDFAKQFDPKNLSKTLAKTTSDPKGETLVKGTSDEKLIRTTKPTGDEGSFRRNARRTKITGDVIPKKDLPKTKGVNQADVSKKAQEFTKQIEKKRVKKLKPIDLKKPTERVDLRKIKKTGTGRKRPSNAPSLADVKKKIDIKNPVEMGKTGPKPVKGTVLKVGKDGFERVRKTKVSAPGGINPEAKKIMSKQVSSDELLGNKKKIEKKIVNNTKNLKNTSKPSLFKRAKDAVKGFHQYMVKDAGYRKTASQNLTRNTFKNTLRGNTLRTINKVLPGKYKALALAAAGTAIGIDQALKNRKTATSAVSTKKPVYKKAVKTLNLDTGKKNN